MQDSMPQILLNLGVEQGNLRVLRKSYTCSITRIMAFFTSAINTLQTLVIALGAGLGVWGAINLLEGYGNDNPGANGQGPWGTTKSLWIKDAYSSLF